jgi:hypothetical protein
MSARASNLRKTTEIPSGLLAVVVVVGHKVQEREKNVRNWVTIGYKSEKFTL